MTFEWLDVLLIICCIAYLCEKVYVFGFVFPKLKSGIWELEVIMGNLEMGMSSVGEHHLDEDSARALILEDVKLMKQWTHDAFIETLNRRPPPEIPAKIIERYGKAGDADHIFS